MTESLTGVLHRIYLSPLAIQADAAREFAQQVAALASLGLISTSTGPGEFGRMWRCTGAGLNELQREGLL